MLKRVQNRRDNPDGRLNTNLMTQRHNVLMDKKTDTFQPTNKILIYILCKQLYCCINYNQPNKLRTHKGRYFSMFQSDIIINMCCYILKMEGCIVINIGLCWSGKVNLCRKCNIVQSNRYMYCMKNCMENINECSIVGMCRQDMMLSINQNEKNTPFCMMYMQLKKVQCKLHIHSCS